MERSEVIAQELFDAIATVEGYSESNDKDGDSDKSQHTLDDVQNLPEEEEASSSEIPYQYSSRFFKMIFVVGLWSMLIIWDGIK